MDGHVLSLLLCSHVCGIAKLQNVPSSERAAPVRAAFFKGLDPPPAPFLNANRSHGEDHHQRRRQEARLGAGPPDAAAQPLAPRHPGRREGQGGRAVPRRVRSAASFFVFACLPEQWPLVASTSTPGLPPPPRHRRDAARPAHRSTSYAIAATHTHAGASTGRAARSRTTTARTT